MEAAGVERDLARFRKSLMVLGFWAKSREGNGLGTPSDSAHILSNPPISAVFLEK